MYRPNHLRVFKNQHSEEIGLLQKDISAKGQPTQNCPAPVGAAVPKCIPWARPLPAPSPSLRNRVKEGLRVASGLLEPAPGLSLATVELGSSGGDWLAAAQGSLAGVSSGPCTVGPISTHANTGDSAELGGMDREASKSRSGRRASCLKVWHQQRFSIPTVD